MCLQHIRLWFGSSGEAHVRRACVSSTYSVRDWHCMASGFAVGRRRRERSMRRCGARRVLCSSVKVTPSPAVLTCYVHVLRGVPPGLSTVLARSALDYPDRCLARSYTAYTDRCTRTEKAAERPARSPTSQRLIRHHVKPNKPNKRRASRMPHGQTNGETIHIYRAERLEDDVTATMSGALTDRTPPPGDPPPHPAHPSAVFTVHSTSPQCPRSRALSLPLALNTPGYTPGSSLDTSLVVI